MNTEYYDFRFEQNAGQLSRIGDIIRAGGIVAVPTETVYGLAANALDGRAVKKIFEAKGRPQDNPLIVHIARLSEWSALVKEIPERAARLAREFWPGPLTIILEKSGIIPDEVSGGLDTVAVRMPSHPVAAAVIRAAGVPLAAPSANLSGKPSPTCVSHVKADLDGRVDAVIDGGECGVGIESTVVTLAGEVPRLLRPGGITPKQLTHILGELEIDDAVFNSLKAGEAVSSPGMKYLHYSPNADVTILRGSLEKFCAYINDNPGLADTALCFNGEERVIPLKCICYGSADDESAQAHNVFEALRELDAGGAKRVVARCPDAHGMGLAVFNRLIRAAGFKIIEL